MSHRLHHTEGLILARQNYGEANAFYQILTPDLGLIGVSAQGVRYLKSKLRSQLATLAHVKLSLVRGREIWRLTAAENSRLLDELFLASDKVALWTRVATLILRLVHGESADPKLFAELTVGLEALNTVSPDTESLINLETIIVLRLLHSLGYVQANVAFDSWSGLETRERERLISLINHGLEHSML